MKSFISLSGSWLWSIVGHCCLAFKPKNLSFPREPKGADSWHTEFQSSKNNLFPFSSLLLYELPCSAAQSGVSWWVEGESDLAGYLPSMIRKRDKGLLNTNRAGGFPKPTGISCFDSGVCSHMGISSKGTKKVLRIPYGHDSNGASLQYLLPPTW